MKMMVKIRTLLLKQVKRMKMRMRRPMISNKREMKNRMYLSKLRRLAHLKITKKKVKRSPMDRMTMRAKR